MESSSISVCSVTWNLHGETPEPSTVNLILNKDVQKYDMYVIGTEECLNSILMSFIKWSKAEWEALLLDNLGHDEYQVVSSETMNAIHIVVIARKEIAKKISCVGSTTIRTGFNVIGYVLSNKGAVINWFKYDNTPMMFINCHLTAYRKNQPTRNDNYHYITNNMKITNYAELFGEDASKEVIGKELMNKFDFILWMGDYNSRNDLSGQELLQYIHENKVDEILKGDQLNKAIANGDIDMNGFKEHPIHFSPTYKFIPGEMKKYYVNEAEGHVPCYADRIFYKLKEDTNIKMNIKSYMTNGQPTLSDHKPVLLLFNLVLP